MFRVISRLTAVVLIVGGTSTLSGNTMFTSAMHDYRVVTVADGLVQPWSIAFLPGGDLLITEQAGRLRVVRNGRLDPRPKEERS